MLATSERLNELDGVGVGGIYFIFCFYFFCDVISVAVADLVLAYVDQAGLECKKIHLSLPKCWSMPP